MQLGAILIEKKNWPEAQKTLKSYTLLRPKDALGWFNLGVAYDYTGTAFFGVDKQALVLERTSLRTDVAGIRVTLTKLQQSEADAKARALAFEERFARLYLRIRDIARVEISGPVDGMPHELYIVFLFTSQQRVTTRVSHIRTLSPPQILQSILPLIRR